MPLARPLRSAGIRTSTASRTITFNSASAVLMPCGASFTKHGLPKQFTAVGYGASQPLSVAENRTGLQRNRRIELRVKGQTDL